MEFTQDWFTRYIPKWKELLGEMSGKPGIRALEVGSFEGRSACWLLENVLTGTAAHLDCVDTFTAPVETVVDHLDARGLRARFDANIAPWRERVTVHVDESANVLRSLTGPYDFIYIDGSHLAPDVLADAVLAWLLLKSGGIMIFDDFRWDRMPRPEQCPGIAIEGFLRCHSGWYDLLHADWQVAIRKRPSYRPDVPVEPTSFKVFESVGFKYRV